MEKTRIVLDADVVIHFIKGESLPHLFNIFPTHKYLVLDAVYQELSKWKDTQNYINNMVSFFPERIEHVSFSPSGEWKKEYALLRKTLGKGEAACMLYCRLYNDVLGSSNLRDIKEYCAAHGITYLTTLDFLYFAYVNGVMSKEECGVFIQKVVSEGSKLPQVDISEYRCEVCL